MSANSDNVCNEGTFRKLFRELSGDLYRFLYYKFGADNHPSDLVQEAFLKLWNNCEKVPPEKAKAFLYTVASNQMLNDLARKKTVLKYREQPMEKYVTHETPEYQLEETQYLERLEAALGHLSDEQRVTFMLNRVEGKKHQEIADMLGISRKTVEKRIYTAIRILKEQLGEF